jgi:hypothetical protein
MPHYSPIFKSATVGEAKVREQKRQAELETDEKNRLIPVFMFKGFGFRPQYRVRGPLYLEGPLCPRPDSKGNICFSELTGESEQNKVICEVCDFSADTAYPLQRFKEIAHKKYEGHLRFLESGGNIETLDVPYEAIKDKSEEDNRAIKIKWSQKDGRNMALIYFIDNSESNDQGEKSQVFVDMDREEIRHDASDIPPGKILAKVIAEFPTTKVELSYKEK